MWRRKRLLFTYRCVSAQAQVQALRANTRLTMTIKEAEGVSPEVAAFTGLEPGPLDDRLGDVCTSITEAVAADGGLECLPKLEKFDPALWSALSRSLSGLGGELASSLASELLEMDKLRKKRGWMKKHRREEARVSSAELCRMRDHAAAWYAA